LKNWSALQLAVTQGDVVHSREKADWMVGVIETWFCENRNLQDSEVADFLAEILDNEFNLQVEDGSLEEVGSKLCEFYAVCSSENESAVRLKMQTLPRCDLDKCKVEGGETVEEEALESIASIPLEMLKVREPKPIEIDEDGFQMVSTRSRRKK